MMKKILLLLIFITMLASCNELTSGTLLEKWIIPAHYESTFTTNKIMGVYRTVENKTYVKTEYIFKIQGLTKKEELKIEEHYVSEYTYSRYSIGDMYTTESR